MPHPIVLAPVANLQDVVQRAVTSANDMWWRGHASAAFTLVPGIHRGGKEPDREKNLFARFRVKAVARYSSCPSENDNASWLFLMQHYGLPTRLLDWSESILVATFFACSERDGEDGDVWGLHP